ncbi:hypothetical protein [Anaerobutyricum hallii]|uniref:hypothetical protein n=1 Tax=Anaerobutyricum hallii TaxID=39488 RepID=UPI0035225584
MRIGMDIKKIHFYLLKHFLRNILLRYLLLIVCLFLVTKGVVSYRSKEVIRNLLIISLILLVLITLCYKLVKRKVTTMYHLAGDVTAKDVDSLSDIIDLYYIFLESALVLHIVACYLPMFFTAMEIGNLVASFLALGVFIIILVHFHYIEDFEEAFKNKILNFLNIEIETIKEPDEEDVDETEDNIMLNENNNLPKDVSENEIDTEKYRESEEGAKYKESEETGVTLNDVIGTMLNSVCGVTIVEKSPTKSEKELDGFSQGKTFSQGNRPDMSSVESLNRRANVIFLLPFMLQLPFLFTNLHNTKLLSLVAIELVAVGILLIIVSKLFTNFYEMFDENKVFPVSVCLYARIIMLLRFAAVCISSCLGTEIFTILKYDKLVYATMGLIVICAILLNHNYKKTTDEIKKLNK